MATRIQLRRGTAAQWTNANPVLALGEPAVETDTGRSKVGNGADVWADLDYYDEHVADAVVASGAVAAAVDASPTIADHETRIETTETVSGVLSALRFDPASPHYGAVRGTGMSPAQRTANTAALNLAASDAASANGTLVIKGTYEITGQVHVTCHVDAHDGTLSTNSTSGVALLVGVKTTGTATRHRTMHLPSVIQTGRTRYSGTWTGSDIGIEIANLFASEVTIPYVENFKTNVRLTAYGYGNTYNSYYIGALHDGQTVLHLSPQAGGWVNENIFYNGQYRIENPTGHNYTPIAGTRLILLDDGMATGGFKIDNNVFIKPCVEGNLPEFHVELRNCVDNMFIGTRWEVPAAQGNPRLRLDTSYNNQFFYGYNARNLELTLAGDSNSNHFYDKNRIRAFTPAGSGGILTLANKSHGSLPVLTVMEAAMNENSPATSYSLQISAQEIRGKGSTDAFAKFKLITGSGELRWGTGTAEPTITLGRQGTANLRSSGILIGGGGLGSGNTTAASNLGSVVRRMAIYDENGQHLGYVPIYDSIT